MAFGQIIDFRFMQTDSNSPSRFDCQVSVCAIEPAASACAVELASELDATLITLATAARDEHEVVILCGLPTSNWNKAWQLVWLGRIAAPIAYVVGVSKWSLRTRTCAQTIMMDRPSPEALLQSFTHTTAVFLNCHGRADALLLRGGRVCGGPRLARGESLDDVPACALTGMCYRESAVSVANRAPALLFTNACESMVIGEGAPMHAGWSVTAALTKAGIATLVGTPGYRHGRRDEIVMAAALFNAGFPAWQVLRAVNRGLSTAQVQVPSLVLSGDPFVTVAVPSHPTHSTIDLSATSEQIKVSAETASRVTLPAPGWRLRTTNGSVSALPVANEVWLAGHGTVVVHSPDSSYEPRTMFDRAIADADALAHSCAIAGDDRHESSIAYELQVARTAGAALLPGLPVSPDAARKLGELAMNITHLRRKRQRAFVNRLARCIADPTRTHFCLTDLVDRHLTKQTVQADADCPDCGEPSVSIAYDSGWHGVLCTRCGMRSVRSGQPLVVAIDFPSAIPAGSTVCARVNTVAECWSAGVLRGKVDGVECRVLDADSAQVYVASHAPPHFFFLKVYAAHNGTVEAITRRFRVVMANATSGI